MRLHPYAPFGILIAVTIGGVALTSTLEKTHNSMKAKPATSSIVKVTPKPVAKVIQFEAASGISKSTGYGGEITTKEANDTHFITVRKNGQIEEVLIATAYFTHWNVHACKSSGEYSYLGSLHGASALEPAVFKPAPEHSVMVDKYCHIVYNKGGAVSAVSFTPNKTEPNPISAVSDTKRCRVRETCDLYSVKTKWAQAYSKDFTLTELESTVLKDIYVRYIGGGRRNSPWPTDINAITKECNKGDKSSCEYLEGYRLAYKAHETVTIRPTDSEYHKNELITECNKSMNSWACDELETMGIRI